MKCLNCGNDLLKSEKFCPLCGAEQDLQIVLDENATSDTLLVPDENMSADEIQTATSQLYPPHINPKDSAGLLQRQQDDHTVHVISAGIWNKLKYNKQQHEIAFFWAGIIFVFVLMLAGLVGWVHFEHEQNYVIICQNVMRDLPNNNTELITSVKDLNYTQSIDAIQKNSNRISALKKKVESLEKDCNKLIVTDKHERQTQVIKRLLRKEVEIYDDVSDASRRGMTSNISDTIKKIESELEESKSIAAEIDTPDMDIMSAVQDLDAVLPHLRKFNVHAKVIREAEEKFQKEKIAQEKKKALEEQKNRELKANAPDAIRVFEKFHRLISEHRFRDAYTQSFSRRYIKEMPYENWIIGYKTTLKSQPESVKAISGDKESIKLSYSLLSSDSQPNGNQLFQSFKGICILIFEDHDWKIDSLEAEKTGEKRY